MAIAKLLIANRGEIAIRIAAAAADLGIATLAVHSADDAQSLHCFKADACALLPGTGAAAYLDIAQMVTVALAHGCDAVHPGYGFLSENADFARACAAAGIIFVGPSAAALDLFANKANARALAQRTGVPVMPGSDGAVTLQEAQAFYAGLGAGAAVMIKAVAGGGGRGMRIVAGPEHIAAAYAACQAEAKLAFGDDALFVERFMARARHIEVQIVADGQGGVIHLGERECSLQRRNQKIVEIAPCPDLSPVLRGKITAAAVRLASAADYRNIGTFEFLVDADRMRDQPEDGGFFFLEANPRIQVEHTITEEVMDVDLVQTQLRIAAGATLGALGLDRTAAPRGFALQARINMEVMTASGEARPSLGVIGSYEMPSGRGVRIDGYGYAGYAINPRYDSLLAKLIVHVPGDDFTGLLTKARRALGDCRITGVETNIALLRALLARPELAAGGVHTRFV
ncbi:MAG: urea carboxylase, partial [Sphingomonas sp.]|nr:urea carboxylase [Sphingomonas sp.]